MKTFYADYTVQVDIFLADKEETILVDVASDLDEVLENELLEAGLTSEEDADSYNLVETALITPTEYEVQEESLEIYNSYVQNSDFKVVLEDMLHQDVEYGDIEDITFTMELDADGEWIVDIA